MLSRNDNGFVLMVESGLIDKYTHVLDMERAVYDTIMLDNAVKLARDWASARGDDTLILVVADHNHPISLIGTIEDDMAQGRPPGKLREGVRVYDGPAFRTIPRPMPRAIRRASMSAAGLRCSRRACRTITRPSAPKLDGPNDPTVAGKEPNTFVANERYKTSPGAMLRLGNLPAAVDSDVHSGEDVILTATGPGSDRVHGQMENTEVFRIIAEALGLGHRGRPRRATAACRSAPAWRVR